jgi:hypothetical protein
VVDAGKIVELGAHDDLVAQGGHYFELVTNWQQSISTNAVSPGPQNILHGDDGK